MGRRGVKAAATPAETRAQRQGSRRDGVQEVEQGSKYKTSRLLTSAGGTEETKVTGQASGRMGVSIPPQPLSSLPGEPGPTIPRLTSVALRALLGSY